MTMANDGKVLVIGATGTIGRETLKALAAKDGRVRALVRSTAAAEALGAGVEPVLGDLRDEAAVARALRGVSAALYTAPHTHDEEELALRFIAACETAGVRLVYAGVHADAETRLGRALLRAAYGVLMSHYSTKFRMSERARISRTRAIVLAPTNFFQNDAMFYPEILGGSFVNVFKHAINRVDVRDVGRAAANALLDDSVAPGGYPIVGPRSLTGDDCAATWTQALGREVRSEHDIERVRAALTRELDDKKQVDFVKTYKVFQHFALPTKPAQLERTIALLGRTPIDYAAYVREEAARIAAGRVSSAA